MIRSPSAAAFAFIIRLSLAPTLTSPALRTGEGFERAR